MSSPVIWNGTQALFLLSKFQCGNGNAAILSGSANPSSTPTTGAAGDAYLSTSVPGLFIKQDAGSSTNWTQMTGGVTTIGTFGSSPTANAASISGLTLTIQPADGTHPGAITSGTQTIGGAKTFSSTIAASNLSGTNTGDITLTAIGSTPNANGSTLTAQALNLQPANGSFGGIVTTAAQTFAGAKTFSNNLTLSTTLIRTVTTNSTATGSNADIASIPTGFIALTNNSLTSISSIFSTGVVLGQTVVLQNQVGGPVTIVDNGSSPGTSTAIYTGYTANVVLADGSSAAFQLDTSINVWRMLYADHKVTLSSTNFVTGTLAVGNGGTGLATLTAHAVLLGEGTSAITPLALDASTTKVLTSGGSSADPTWSAISATNITTGTLAIANGGTGNTTATAAFAALSPITTKGDLIGGTGTNAEARLAVGANGTHLIADSTQTTGMAWVAIGTTATSGATANTAWPVASTAWFDLTSLSLAAGTWWVSGMMCTDFSGGAGTAGNIQLAVTTTTGNSGTGVLIGQNDCFSAPADFASGRTSTFTIPGIIVTPGSTTTYYLKANADDATNLRYKGYTFNAVRIA